MQSFKNILAVILLILATTILLSDFQDDNILHYILMLLTTKAIGVLLAIKAIKTYKPQPNDK